MSEEIFTEYQRVGAHLAASFPKADLEPFLKLLALNSEFVLPEKLQKPVCKDPDDDKFIACEAVWGRVWGRSSDLQIAKLNALGKR